MNISNVFADQIIEHGLIMRGKSRIGYLPEDASFKPLIMSDPDSQPKPGDALTAAAVTFGSLLAAGLIFGGVVARMWRLGTIRRWIKIDQSSDEATQ